MEDARNSAARSGSVKMPRALLESFQWISIVVIQTIWGLIVILSRRN